MMVLNDDNISKYKSYASNWIDEPISKLSHYSTEQPRKIIREFYSSNFSTRWPENIVPYEISPELSKQLNRKKKFNLI